MLWFFVLYLLSSVINLNTWTNAGDIILFIDEVHTLIGSGSVGRGNNSSGLDIANLLKPALGRGELQVEHQRLLLLVKRF